uniref:Uncharacterized protein n=1 Tax=Triticum urartu TaxID=4572 RepID=A0A8R7UC56_TRIUA
RASSSPAVLRRGPPVTGDHLEPGGVLCRPSSSSAPTSARGQDPLDPVLFVDRSSGSDRPHPSCTSTVRIRADLRLPPSPTSPRRRSRSSVRQAPRPCFVSLREEQRVSAQPPQSEDSDKSCAHVDRVASAWATASPFSPHGPASPLPDSPPAGP